MWAWLTTLDPDIDRKTVQSLPRELSLAEDGTLRIHPLRELETLRYDAEKIDNFEVRPSTGAKGAARYTADITELDGDAFEIRIGVERTEAERNRFGFLLFSSDDNEGLPVLFRPESGTICVGETETPFSVADLPEHEDIDLRIFADKYLVEVFVNGRQAALTAHMDYRRGNVLKAYLFRGRDAGPLKIRSIEIWKLKPTNQGFLEARESRNWAPDID